MEKGKWSEEEIRDLIKDELKRKNEIGKSFNEVPYHEHTGSDSAKIDPNNLLGFPVRLATPTESAIQGKLVLSDISGTRRIHVRINGAWYSVAVT